MIWGNWESLKRILDTPEGEKAILKISKGIDKVGGSIPENIRIDI